jgi:hypothetical protein
VTRSLLSFVSIRMPRPFGVAVFGLLLLVFAACDSEPATQTPPSAEASRDQTVQTLRGLSSVRFEITHPNGGTDMGGGLMLNTVEGVALFPSSARMSAKGAVQRIAVSFGIVQTNSTTYFSGPIGDTWRVVPPESLPFDFIGMNTSVATALANASGITVAPGEQVKGKHIFLLSGAIVSDDLQGLVPGAASGLPLTIECWIGQEDGLPWKVVLTGALISSDPETMVRQLDLNAFDEPVTVEAPI